MVDENVNYPGGKGTLPRTLEVQNAEGERRFSPSVSRNRGVLREAFVDNVCGPVSVLEIGSGTGEHGVFLTEERADIHWTFSDHNEEALSGIAAWMEHAGRDTLHGPYLLDASAEHWGPEIEGQTFDIIFSANVVHISPVSVLAGIFAAGERILTTTGRLVFYGPFARNGVMVDSNKNFDADLKRRDAGWGVRDLDTELIPLASKAGLKLTLTAAMPKNNYFLIFSRA